MLYSILYLALTFLYSRSSAYKNGQCLLPNTFSLCKVVCGALLLQVYGNSSNFFLLLFEKNSWYSYTVQIELDGGFVFARDCGCVKGILIYLFTGGY